MRWTDLAVQVRGMVHSRLGAFCANTVRGPGRCMVCTAPADAELCGNCRSQRQQFGPALADLVVPLTYVRGWMSPPHQSEHHVRRYKHPVHPTQRCMDDLRLMVLAATLLHGPCIARAVGWWQVVTFVPSATRQGIDHPVVELARQVVDHNHPVERVLLSPGPAIGESDRWPRTDRFLLQPAAARLVTGKHVLVVDDTWVSGGKAQSASLTLKAAGAGAVTVLCVGRWLSYRWSEHRPLIESYTPPYDALVCPVGVGPCLLA